MQIWIVFTICVLQFIHRSDCSYNRVFMIYEIQIIEIHTVVCVSVGFLFHYCDKGFYCWVL